MQYSPEYLDTLEKVRNTPVVTADGRSVPLGDDRRRVGAQDAGDDPQRQRHAGRATSTSTCRTSRPPTTSSRRRQFLAKNLTLPAGYSLEWTGLYQYADGGAGAAAHHRAADAGHHLRPAGRWRSDRSSESVLILLSVPFAMVGGVFLQWVLGYPMTTAVIVGYISLFAVAVQTGIIMVIFIREALDAQAGRSSRTSMPSSTVRRRGCGRS